MEELKLTMPRTMVEFIYARANLALQSKLTDDDRMQFAAIINLAFRALNASPALFVWVKGPRGAQAQIWMTGEDRKNQKPVVALQKHSLTSIESKLTIAQLSELYPYKTPANGDIPVALKQ